MPNSVRKLLFRGNLLYVAHGKVYRRLRSRSVHFLGNHCRVKNRTAAQWRLLENPVFRPQEKSEFDIAQRFSVYKYPKSAQT